MSINYTMPDPKFVDTYGRRRQEPPRFSSPNISHIQRTCSLRTRRDSSCSSGQMVQPQPCLDQRIPLWNPTFGKRLGRPQHVWETGLDTSCRYRQLDDWKVAAANMIVWSGNLDLLLPAIACSIEITHIEKQRCAVKGQPKLGMRVWLTQ